MGMEPLVLVVNPGSASRKYSLYRGDSVVAQAHFEFENGQIVCGLRTGRHPAERITSFGEANSGTMLSTLRETSAALLQLLIQRGVIANAQEITGVGVRIVAPSSYFLEDRIIDDACLEHLRRVEAIAPLHVSHVREEIDFLRAELPGVPLVGVSDSAFHITKPDYNWNYGLPLELSDQFDIKRFGYHGISVAAIVRSLESHSLLRPKTVVAHLGSGCSVTGVLHGKSIDNSMGFSPLEGLMMSTRSGTIDLLAANELGKRLNLDTNGLVEELNEKSGLAGVSGISSDIRVLLDEEAKGNYRAGLALRMFVGEIQQYIARMAAELNGIDLLVFTGTVGERSFIMRRRIAENLQFMGVELEQHTNDGLDAVSKPMLISPKKHHPHVYVMHSDEDYEIAQRTAQKLGGTSGE